MKSRNDLINSKLFSPLVRQYTLKGGGGNAIDIVDDSDLVTITKSTVNGRDRYVIGDQGNDGGGGGGGGTTKQVQIYRGVYEYPYVPPEEVEKYASVTATLKNQTFTFDTADGGYWWVALPVGTAALFYFGVTNVQPYVISGQDVNGQAYDIYVSPALNRGGISIIINGTNFPSGSPTAPIDTTNPELVLSSDTGNVTSATPIPMTITASEAVGGMSLADIIVTGGVAQNLNGAGSSYTFEITPDGDGEIRVKIKAGAVSDGAGNASDESNEVIINYTSGLPTPKIYTEAISDTVIRVGLNPHETYSEIDYGNYRYD